ncbi:MAG TPA: extracellular solute-binding protein [Acidimicrobiales bacterium]|nr:extracellular solute-binding protein [Acidimicrobiales bacterium]
MTLQYWSTYNTADKEASTIAKVIIPAFEKANPGIKVVSSIYPYSDLLNKFIATSAAGNPPDVMRSDIAWVAQLAQQGIVQNVGRLKAFTAIRKDALPGPLLTTEVNGKFYAIPDDTNTQALYWNKADFAAAGIAGPPTTITQMLADAQALTIPSKQQYGLGVDGTDIWNMAPYIWSMGGSFTNANYSTASGHMDSAATQTAVSTLVSALKSGYIGSDFQGGASAVSGEAGFPKGEYAMYIDGPWAVPTYSGLSPVPSYGIALFPSGSAGSLSTVGGEDTVVAKQGHHVADAEKFAEFLASPFAQLAMAKQGDMSAFKSDSAKEVKATPYYSVFAKQLLTAKIRANSPGYSQLDSDWSTVIGQILAGNVTVSAGLATATQEANSALAGS